VSAQFAVIAAGGGYAVFQPIPRCKKSPFISLQAMTYIEPGKIDE